MLVYAEARHELEIELGRSLDRQGLGRGWRGVERVPPRLWRDVADRLQAMFMAALAAEHAAWRPQWLDPEPELPLTECGEGGGGLPRAVHRQQMLTTTFAELTRQ